MDDIETVAIATEHDLGDPRSWRAPVEFRNSLALCALSLAYSLRGSTPAVKNVLARYRALRPTADTDTGLDLVAAMDTAGGAENFAREVLSNGSFLPGTSQLRTVGIYDALVRLASLSPSVTTAAQLRIGDDAVRARAFHAWTSTKGLGPQSWSYLIMNAGVDTDTKPDVMVRRYLSRVLSLDRGISQDRARELLRGVAERRGVRVRSLDRAIWLHESPHAEK